MFSNTRIGTRLMCLIAIQCLLLLVVGLVGLAGAAHSKDRLHGVYGNSIVPLLYLDAMLNLNLQMRAQLEQALSADHPAAAEKHFARAAALGAEGEKAWRDYAATSMSPEERKLADTVEQAHQEWSTARDEVSSAFRSNGRTAAMEADRRVERSSKFDRWHAAVDKLVAYQARDAQAAYRDAAGENAQAQWTIVVALVFGVAFAAAVAWVMIGSIARPMALKAVIRD